MPRRWQRRGARSTGNLSSMSYRAEIAELGGLVKPNGSEEPGAKR
jgi:hypothetical protein